MLIVFIADLLRAFNKLMYTVDLLGGGGYVLCSPSRLP